MIHETKPSLSELSHHGVKGMKWGKRHANPTTGDIKKARRDFEAKRGDFHDAKKNVRKTTKRGSAEREAGNKEIAKMKLHLLKDPDRVTAARLTRGEKAIYTALGVTTGVSAIPLAVGVTVNKLTRDHIERKQLTGGYDKKK